MQNIPYIVDLDVRRNCESMSKEQVDCVSKYIIMMLSRPKSEGEEPSTPNHISRKEKEEPPQHQTSSMNDSP